MIKRLAVLALFVLVGCISLLAQSPVDLSNKSGEVTYSGVDGFQVYAALAPKGYIDLGSGPVSDLMPSGGSFSGNGASFTYSVPNVGTGTTQNVSGSLSVLSTSSRGESTYVVYELYMTFSGYDSYSRAFNGFTTQLIRVRTSHSGSSMSVFSGATVLQLN